MSDQYTQDTTYSETLESILETLKENGFPQDELDFENEIVNNYPQLVNNDQIDWQVLEDSFEYILKSYLKDVSTIRKQIDDQVQYRKNLTNLYEKFDQERARKRLEKSEIWISSKSDVLKKFKVEVSDYLQNIELQCDKLFDKQPDV